MGAFKKMVMVVAMVATVYGIWWLVDGPGFDAIMDKVPSVNINR